MPQRKCINPKCRRLIYDTEKLDELPDKIECQHCHRMNIHRHIKRQNGLETPAPVAPGPEKTTDLAATKPVDEMNQEDVPGIQKEG